MVIYVDVLLLTNFYVDYLLLLATEKIAGVSLHFWRRVIGALISSLFSLCILLPSMHLVLQICMKALCAVSTVTIAFGKRRWKTWVRLLASFLVATYAFAGVFLLLQQIASGVLVKNFVIYLDVSPLILVGFTTVAYLFLTIYRFIVKRPSCRDPHYRITIVYQGREVSTDGFCDTGNRLSEPISGAPVLVVSETIAKTLLTADDLDAMKSQSSSCQRIRGFRLIPYRSLGNSGLLSSFSPSSVTINHQRVGRCFVALSPTPLEDDINALFGMNLLEKGELDLCGKN